MVLFSLYSIIVIPFQFAFLPEDSVPVSNLVADTGFFIDLLVQIVSIHKNSLGDEIRPWKLSFLHYARRWFIIDCVAAIPFSYISLIDSEIHNSERVPIRFLKLSRLFKVRNQM